MVTEGKKTEVLKKILVRISRLKVMFKEKKNQNLEIENVYNQEKENVITGGCKMGWRNAR